MGRGIIGNHQKLKLLYLKDLLLKKTDDNHGLTTQDIIEELEKMEVIVERKTFYKDIEELSDYGLDINKYKKGKQTYYNILEREFELPELKLLVDAVYNSKFITPKKTRELIKKIEGLTSEYEGKKLQRQIIAAKHKSTENELIYLNVDHIHEAISENKQIEFQYFNWNLKKEKELRHNGMIYIISPWSMVWDSENYYMIGYDSEDGIIKNYRVDKMVNVNITQKTRDGRKEFEKIDISSYGSKVFGMFGGDEVSVHLRCSNEIVGVIIDRFGRDIIIIPQKDGKHFTTNVNVVPSTQFYGWIFSLGGQVQVTAPENVVKEIKKEAGKIADIYL